MTVAPDIPVLVQRMAILAVVPLGTPEQTVAQTSMSVLPARVKTVERASMASIAIHAAVPLGTPEQTVNLIQQLPRFECGKCGENQQKAWERALMIRWSP